jgi:hypothetical protein
MNWKKRVLEQWMRFGFVALLIVGIVCTLIIVAQLK